MAGADTIDQAIELQREISSLLQSRGFQLRKWTSNDQKFLDAIPPDKCSTTSLRIDDNPDAVKVLGLKWIPAEDYFTFDVNPTVNLSITKRNILSESSKIFDPLGLLALITVSFKILLQGLWLSKYDWDEPISGNLVQIWNDIRSNIQHITKLRIPRWLFTDDDNLKLHSFSDASQLAYGALVYSRHVLHDGQVQVNLITAKTRVAPIKQVYIPRLELCGALLLTRLIQAVKLAFEKAELRCFAWTDSKVVLDWLSAPSRKWKCFIGNRTAEILTELPRACWNYVSSADNPADIASRGMNPKDLSNSTLWWQGPSWLKEDWTTRIKSSPAIVTDEAMKEKRETYIEAYVVNHNDILSFLFERKSSLNSIYRILGWSIRFYQNCRNSVEQNFLTLVNSKGVG